MADINVERKQRSVWPLLLTLLLVAAIAVAAWVYLGSNGDDETDAPPAAEVQTAPDATSPAPGMTDPGAQPPATTTESNTTTPPSTTGY